MGDILGLRIPLKSYQISLTFLRLPQNGEYGGRKAVRIRVASAFCFNLNTEAPADIEDPIFARAEPLMLLFTVESGESRHAQPEISTVTSEHKAVPEVYGCLYFNLLRRYKADKFEQGMPVPGMCSFALFLKASCIHARRTSRSLPG